MPFFKDLTGKKFGRLTAISRSSNKVYPSGFFRTMWLCRCDCGTEVVVDTTCLSTGHTKSCGCYQKEQTSKANKKYGASNRRLYCTWKNMLDRANNPKNHAYKLYGGRGIHVCSEWESFDKFVEWSLSHGYREYLTIDRIDNDGGYEPTNCRWVTHKEQSRNRSTNFFIEFRGEVLCLIDASKKYKIHKNTLRARLKRGWPIERALLEPVHEESRNRRHLCG